MSQLHVCLVPTLAASVNHSVTSFPPSCMIEFKSGLITVKVYLHRTGYVAGETILLHADVDNQSQTTLLGSTVSLIEVIFTLVSFYTFLY